MTGVTGVIYTNFKVTPCNEKCNFFLFSRHREGQQHDFVGWVEPLVKPNISFIPNVTC